ncbi:MAG TPA: periplasmic heavy metal sensor [Rhizomicrobium sp.]|jgi:Spy/CpxP family protein refolding chaperone
MNNVTKLALAAVFALVCAGPAMAQGPSMQTMSMPESHDGMGHHGMGMMHDAPFLMLLKSANLTNAQHAQVRQILQAAHAQSKPVMQQFQALHEQIAGKLLSAGPLSASDLAPLTRQAFRLHQQLEQNMIDTALAIRNVLTPEQINRLAQVHQQLSSLHKQIQSLMGSDEGNMGGDESN